ncbi:unnamed protein product [Acanthoscelides obtectus]|uniref:Protein outspread n=1 Tax=Acanthoscelides obtectus TaxID=200917 RepID=A0A9P0NPF5_ACAOB|nr:unnamed protein product [Acanthoscelides obtectus]CAK1661524.1 Protein outspread [Acanthoscelides obtectus]
MSQCKKFSPNIFHKTKCSNCFRQKEEHSAEALECNRVFHINVTRSAKRKCAEVDMRMASLQATVRNLRNHRIDLQNRSPIHVFHHNAWNLLAVLLKKSDMSTSTRCELFKTGKN